MTAQKAMQLARSALLAKLHSKILSETVIPIAVKVYMVLQRARSSLIQYLIPFLVQLYQKYKSQVEEVLLTLNDDLYGSGNRTSMRSIRMSKTILKELQLYALKAKQRRDDEQKAAAIQEAKALVSAIVCFFLFRKTLCSSYRGRR